MVPVGLFETPSAVAKPIPPELAEWLERMVIRGGPGSGHRGHKGRPGKVGGSLPREEGLTGPVQTHFQGMGEAVAKETKETVEGFGFNDRTPELLERLEEIESMIKDSEIEHAYVIDMNGEIIWNDIGGRDHVYIPEDVTMENAILFHNHPRSTSLSPEDLYTSWVSGANEVIVTSPKGYRYIMRFPKMSLSERDETSDKLESLLRTQNEKVRASFWAEIHNNRMTADEAEFWHNDRVNQLLEEEKPEWFDYERE